MHILEPTSTVLRHGADLDHRVSPPSPPLAKDLSVKHIMDRIIKIKVVYKPLLLHGPFKAFPVFGFEILVECLRLLML